ncbi:MAG: pyridoxamine 5'-phosphate oxidase family protein [Gammaproteobacteria bacterium]|nr:MAG: pyridoxamine 5'-phosphate oxidase family protein [Gammaproteobacteria bacterium]
MTMPTRLENRWNPAQIHDYLDHTTVPMRLACHTPSGYPQVVSIWYLRDGQQLVGITHQSSHLMRLIKQNPHVGFEVAVNEPPYRGIRGFGDIEWGKAGARDVMQQLVTRYLGNNHDALASWLMSRVDEEMVLRIHPVSISSWDYRSRMGTPNNP